MAGQDRKRLQTARAAEATQATTRQTIAKHIEAMRLANERGNLTALDTARTAITTARSTDTRV